jgi:hypothetical protein
VNKLKDRSKTSIDATEQFLAMHGTVDDLRLHALLWFNAFEQTMRSILAWRLGCTDRSLPRILTKNSSLLFDVTLAGHDQLRKHVDRFAQARNSIAHRFHEGGYEQELVTFCEEVLGEGCPEGEEQKLKFLSKAVRHLAIDISCALDESSIRGDFPFPQLLFELGE